MSEDADFVDLSEATQFTHELLVRLRRLSTPAVSGDGKHVCFVLETTEPATKFTVRKNLWLYTFDTGVMRQLTTGCADTSPQFTGDSLHVAFLRTDKARDIDSQAFVIAIGGGEARQLSFFDVPVDDLRWCPTDCCFAFAAAVYLDDEHFGQTAERTKAEQSSPVRAYEQLPVRDWNVWRTERRRHVFVVPITTASLGGFVVAGPPRDLLANVDADAPGGVMYDAHLSFSADGRRVTFVAKHRGQDSAWSTNTTIVVVRLDDEDGGDEDAETTKKPEQWAKLSQITSSSNAADTSPCFSPNGRFLAFVSLAEPQCEYDRGVLKIFDARKGTVRVVTGHLDVSVDEGSLQWPKGGSYLLFTCQVGVAKSIVRIDLRTKKVKLERLASAHVTHWMHAITHERIVMMRSSIEAPADLFLLDLADKDKCVRQLTHVNADMLSGVEMRRRIEVYDVPVRDDAVSCTFVDAAVQSSTDDGKTPLLVLLHGGPQSVWADSWHWRWNCLALQFGGRFALCVVNFHGSTGRGDAFTKSLRGRWSRVCDDAEACVLETLRRYPHLSSTNVFAAGGSYGGYATLALNAATTRYRALICHAGIFDLVSMYYSTEELFFPEFDFFGAPADHPAESSPYVTQSPVNYVDRMSTPTLILHGAKDYRVPLSQGLMAFTALQRRGVHSRLVVFDEEGHWVLNRESSIRWHREVEEFLLAHLDDEEEEDGEVASDAEASQQQQAAPQSAKSDECAVM